ncbi:ANF_receptor domain-containing protein [Caerostris extrusa]|uniref:ANF_receptor domain-containing protein n=1 Tax=Caerostris extrusa TaxID=172846 RepID=A0AAV4TUD7_CAEEX|nr:ANF_receptor domain-containing protein [Caerostris extrusa]
MVKLTFSLFAVCDLLGEGMAAIFGPQSTESSSVVQSTCGALEVPHIQTRWEYRLKPRRNNINLYPPPNALGSAYLAYVREKNWKVFAILYETNDEKTKYPHFNENSVIGKLILYPDCIVEFMGNITSVFAYDNAEFRGNDGHLYQKNEDHLLRGAKYGRQMIYKFH